MRPPPPDHTKWKKGQSGNASGKPKQLLTKDKVSSILGKFATMTRDELQKVMQDSKTPMIEIMIAAVIIKAAKDGDYSRLDFLLSRSIGKVKDEIEQTIKSIDDSDLDVIPREALIRLAAGGDK